MFLLAASSFFSPGVRTADAPRRFHSAVRPSVRSDVREDESSRLVAALAAYERAPTAEGSEAVWEALAGIERRIETLRAESARCAGSSRAEAEIERMELQRLCDEGTARCRATRNNLHRTLEALAALLHPSERAERSDGAACVLVKDLRTAPAVSDGLY